MKYDTNVHLALVGKSESNAKAYDLTALENAVLSGEEFGPLSVTVHRTEDGGYKLVGRYPAFNATTPVQELADAVKNDLGKSLGEVIEKGISLAYNDHARSFFKLAGVGKLTDEDRVAANVWFLATYGQAAAIERLTAEGGQAGIVKEWRNRPAK